MNEGRISGFDPTKHLRKTISEAGETVMRLELPYQKLWFRQTHPSGRMVLNPLRLTDQLAIFEAKVFFQKDDSTPASSFTANKTVLETPGYIRAAQDEALSEALENAGFGYQTYDIPLADGHEQRGRFIPPVQDAEPKANVQAVQATAQTVRQEVYQSQPAPLPSQPQTGEQAADTVVSASADRSVQPATRETEPEQPQAESAFVPEHAPVQAVQQTAPPAQFNQETTPQPDGQSSAVATLLDFPQTGEQPGNRQERTDTDMSDADAPPADIAPAQTEAPPQAAPAYTENMSVEDICQHMTLEEARNVVVPKGPCGGWTMAQVAEKRFSSLRFYLTQFCDYSNIHKAAAMLLIQDAEQKKAG